MEKHYGEGQHPYYAQVMPIFHTSLFSFPGHATGAAICDGSQEGCSYTHTGNPNTEQFANRAAMLEALD